MTFAATHLFQSTLKTIAFQMHSVDCLCSLFEKRVSPRPRDAGNTDVIRSRDKTSKAYSAPDTVHWIVACMSIQLDLVLRVCFTKYFATSLDRKMSTYQRNTSQFPFINSLSAMLPRRTDASQRFPAAWKATYIICRIRLPMAPRYKVSFRVGRKVYRASTVQAQVLETAHKHWIDKLFQRSFNRAAAAAAAARGGSCIRCQRRLHFLLRIAEPR